MRKYTKNISQALEDFHFLLTYFSKYKKYYLIGLSSLFIVDSLEVVPPFLLKIIVDALGDGKATLNLLLKISVVYMTVAIIQSFMRYLWRKYIIRTSMFASNDMRIDLFNHICTLDPSFFRKNRVGELVSLATNDTETVRFALGQGPLVFFDALFYFITITPVMLYMSPKLTLISLLPMALLPFFIRKMEKIIQKNFTLVQEKFSSLAAHCQESLAGIRIIKGAALESLKEKEFAGVGQEYIQANLKSAVSQTTLNTVLEFFVSLAITTLFVLGGSYVLRERITIGVFVAFQRYIQKMSWPMEAIGLAANILQRSIASQKRIEKIKVQEAQIKSDKAHRSPEIKSCPKIEVKNLSFSYPGSGRKALQNISFILEPGAHLGLVGSVGSGKSTLLSCLARMEAVPRGTIFFDDIDVLDIPVHQLRKMIGFVPQESFLFSKSIEENILYGHDLFLNKDASTKLTAARKAAEAANMHAEIEKFPEYYETLLGERGVNLSGGQKQRLTIARAMATNAAILLFDDCLSAIDSETERKLIHSLYQATTKHSVIISSHRPSSIEQLDWVLVMQDGIIVEQGHPSDLKKPDNFFSKLYKQNILQEQLDLMELK